MANHVEDRFGRDLVHAPVENPIPNSEMHDGFSMDKTMFAAGRDNFVAKPVTEDEIEAEEGYKEYETAVCYTTKGQPNHILIGHGPTQGTFETREFATTNETFYGKAPNADKTTQRDLFLTNTKQDDIPTLFKPTPDRTHFKKSEKF
eukprot:CAMPEP_0197006614 /NCGR_PEP_ID=MMETSP1380-20130617/36123_1 /TAXON_ID=5936 /ORGANISM="Euplotes crassus, Strain CT5" /LENGTH=146 /DNA_ID=CAMNT_0042426275 /DNA_START=53 /DNA_END=493 /DNA_ORIENTATION=-